MKSEGGHILKGNNFWGAGCKILLSIVITALLLSSTLQLISHIDEKDCKYWNIDDLLDGNKLVPCRQSVHTLNR